MAVFCEAVPVIHTKLQRSKLVRVSLPILMVLILRLDEVWHVIGRWLVDFIELERSEKSGFLLPPFYIVNIAFFIVRKKVGLVAFHELTHACRAL